MLKFLLSLSPSVLGIVAGLGGASITMAGFSLWNAWIDNPTVERIATNRANDAATIRIQAAADAAEKLTEERIRKAGQQALADYQRITTERDKLRAEQNAELEQRIKDYEAQLVEQKRACLLDDLDIDWLSGGNPSGPANSSGGGPRRSPDEDNSGAPAR